MGNEVRFAVLSIRRKYANNVQSNTEMMTQYKKNHVKKIHPETPLLAHLTPCMSIYDIRFGHRGAGRDLDRLRLGHHGHDIHVLVRHGLVRRCSAGCRAEGSGSASYPGLAGADQPAASAEAAGIAVALVAAEEAAGPEEQVADPFGG